MSHLKPLLAAFAATLLSSTAGAQTVNYDVNWVPLHASGAATIAGPAAFSGGGLFGHNAHIGDSIRRCYPHDVTQGGRSQSKRKYEHSYFQWTQAFAPNNPVAGVDAGFVSIQAGTESLLGGDVCISPFGSSPGNTGAHNLGGFAGSIGLLTGTSGAGFPGFWELAFQWAASSVGNVNWIGVEGNHPFLHPLLVNVIFEVQGPANGTSNVQYYLGTTIEKAGVNASAPGGVTRGNPQWGSAVYAGADPITSNAISHTRIIINNNAAGLLLGPLAPFGGGAGRAELWARLANKAPVLWAVMDGHDGAGATDWHVGSAPVAVVNIRMTDTRAGAESNFDLYWKAPGGPPAVPSSIANPTLFFNQGYLLWSAKKSTGQQRPTSWDDLHIGGVPLLPAQKGSILLGSVATFREGMQTVPANFDSLMQALIPITALSLLGPFSRSEDPFIDGTVPDSTGTSHSVIWEGGLDPIISGIATLSGGALPIVGSPSPSLVGAKIGLAAVGIQLDASVGFFTYTTEVASSMEVVFQP
jgi:hypothetical protein